ncbi:MAG: DHA2 family efflux MFS transporter permease subunit [Mycobacterium sp.]
MNGAESAPSRVRIGSAAGRWVIAATVLGSGMAQLDATVVNVALPAIGRDLSIQTSGLQLVVSAYSVTLAALILLSGSLGDRLGRRRVFVVGVVWFAVASAICAGATNVESLIAARALQGIGGALMTPGSLAIIQASFIPADRAKAIGAWSALGGVAAAIGPLLGGYLVQAVSWRAIFLINVPIGCVVAWLALRHVPESRDPLTTGRLDYPGATTATVGLAGVTYAIVEGPNRGWNTAAVLTAGVLGVVSIVAFVLIERRTAHPMLPLLIFSSRQFTSANVVTFVVYTALGGVFFLLVLVLQTALGYSPVAAGAASLPVTAIMLGLSSASGALAQRIGPRLPLTVGPLLVAAGMLLMTRIGPGSTYVTAVLPAMVIFGLGLAATVAPVTAAALAAADERYAGAASGVNNAVARAGGLLAVALLPPIAGLTGDAFQSPSAITAGFHTAMLISAGLAVAGAVIAFTSISDDLLTEPPTAAPDNHHFHCALAEVPAPERIRSE